MASRMYTVISLIVITISATMAITKQTETLLLSELLGSNYDGRARPTVNATKVDFRVNIKQINAVSDSAQTVALLTSVYQQWRDPRLFWNSSRFDELDSVSVPYWNIWIPDTTLYNTADMYRPNVEDRGNAIIKTGNDTAVIQFNYNSRHVVGCRFNMKYFPFDEQNCSFVFGSWTYNVNQVDYAFYVATKESFQESDEWNLVSFMIKRELQNYSCCTVPFVVLTTQLVISRKPMYYIFNLILPTLVINFITAFSLFASPGNAQNRHDKVQIGITALLSYCILLQTVSNEIPRGSTSIPLLSFFYFSIMLQNAIKMYIAVYLSYSDRRKFAVKIVCRWKRHKKVTPKIEKDVNANEASADEDRFPEYFCFFLSIACTVFITSIVFGIAYFH